MRTLSVARKILALAVCVSLPLPALAGDLARAPRGAMAPVFGSAAPQFHQELHLKLSSLIPTGVAPGAAIDAQALYSLVETPPQQEGSSYARAQANAFLARMMLLPEAQARQELEAANVSGTAAESILQAARGARERKESDAGLRKAFERVETGKKSESLLVKAAKIARKLESSFKVSGREPVLAGGAPSQEGFGAPDRGAGGDRGLSEGPLLSDGSALPKTPFVPVAHRVTELRQLSLKDPEAAFALAEKILFDDAEPRASVRVNALRLLATFPAERTLPIYLKVATNPKDWYVQRMALQLAGVAAAASADRRDEAIETFKQAYKSSSANVRLMARWSLEQLGVDAGPEPKTSLSESVRGRVPAPTRRSFNDDAGQGPAPKKSGTMKMFVIGGLIFLSLMYLSSNKKPAVPPQPAQVEQTIEAPAGLFDALPAPKTAEQQVQRQMAEDLNALARTAEEAHELRLQELADAKAKAKAANTGGARLMRGLLSVAMLILPIFLLVWLFRRMQGGGGGGGPKGAPGLSGGKMSLEKPDTRFSDVAGVDDALVQLQQLVDNMRNPGRYERLGAKPPRGVLLVGPPGTGKTLLARATAGETGVNFISVKGSDFVEMYVGVGASRMRELFVAARKGQPTIVFMDEIDAVGRARGGAGANNGGDKEHEQTLIALISELDGFLKLDNVTLIAATNRPDVLDPALMRPGRLDRKIHVGNPDLLGREAQLAVHGGRYRLGPDVDLEFAARRTPGLAGAGMANILNEAATQAAVEGHDHITMEDIQRGVDRETFGERRHLFIDDATKERVAYHEAGHVIAGMLGKESGGKAPNKVTIIPHGDAALGYAEPAAESEGDTYLLTMDQIQARIIGAMGGRAAEEVIYGGTDKRKGLSTGPSSDIEDHADRLARLMVEKFGMSERVGIIDAGRDKSSPLGGYKVSEATRQMVDEEVRKITGEALETAKRLLSENRDKLEAMVKILKERETIFQKEIEEIVRPKQK